MSIKFELHGSRTALEQPPHTALVCRLREHLQLTGTTWGFRSGLCGACTVHLDGQPMRACITPISAVAGKSVTTIEGLSKDQSHPLQKAWIETQVPQCGYCQSGQIMQAAALLESNKNPSREEIVAYMNGNICRCGTYLRIIRAIKIAATELNEG